MSVELSLTLDLAGPISPGIIMIDTSLMEDLLGLDAINGAGLAADDVQVVQGCRDRPDSHIAKDGSRARGATVGCHSERIVVPLRATRREAEV